MGSVVTSHLTRLHYEFHRMQQTHIVGSPLILNIQPIPRLLPTAPYKKPTSRQPAMAHSHIIQPLCDLATAIDEAPPWTPDQVAGLAFGALLVVFYFSSKVIDEAVARSQRRELGLCEECGSMYDAASCPKEKCPQKL